jgi:hypothetical protein
MLVGVVGNAALQSVVVPAVMTAASVDDVPAAMLKHWRGSPLRALRRWIEHETGINFAMRFGYHYMPDGDPMQRIATLAS